MSDLSRQEIEEIVRKTVQETLFSLGLNIEDKEDIEEVRKDMAALRDWRKSVAKVKNVGWATAIGVVVTGLFAILFAGLLTFVR